MHHYRWFLATLVLASAVPANAAPPGDTASAVDEGAALYQAHCANCHGVYGEGDGPMAPSLATRPKDLRYLSSRNDGRFPGDYARAIIDGREGRAAHGPEQMPVWGAVLEGQSGAAEQEIGALMEFLRSMQRPLPEAPGAEPPD